MTQQNANNIFGENKSLYYSKEELKDIEKDQEKKDTEAPFVGEYVNSISMSLFRENNLHKR